jgi:hypothetical protein
MGDSERTQHTANLIASGYRVWPHPLGGIIAQYPGWPAVWIKPDGTVE